MKAALLTGTHTNCYLCNKKGREITGRTVVEIYGGLPAHGDKERSTVIHGLVFFDVNAIFLCWVY